MATEQSAKRIRYPLERGWTKWRLIRDLASMDRTKAQLSRAYGVTTSAITQFSQRHAVEIDEVKAAIEDEMAGLWIAQKRARLAEYQQDLEDLAELMALDMDPDTAPREAADPDDPDSTIVVKVGTDVPAISRARSRILKQVAEEMGHLPARVQVNVNDQRVNYSVEGVDLSQLR